MHAKLGLPRTVILTAWLLLLTCVGTAQASAFASTDLFLSLQVTGIRNVSTAPNDPTSVVQIQSGTAVFEDLRNAMGAGAAAETKAVLLPDPPTLGGGALSIAAETSASVPLGGEAVASLATDGWLDFVNGSATDSFAVDVLIRYSVALTATSPADGTGESVAAVDLIIESLLPGDVVDGFFLAISPGPPVGSFTNELLRTLSLGPGRRNTWRIFADALSYAQQAPLPGSAALLAVGLVGLVIARRSARRGPIV
jgi:hypothetical protein